MHVGARAGQQDSIYGVEESIDVGDARTAGEHQWESLCDAADAQKIVFPNVLDFQDITNRVGATNNADYWLAHFSSSLRRCDYHKVIQDLLDVDIRPADGCVFANSCRKRTRGQTGA